MRHIRSYDGNLYIQIPDRRYRYKVRYQNYYVCSLWKYLDHCCRHLHKYRFRSYYGCGHLPKLHLLHSSTHLQQHTQQGHI